MLEFRRAGHVRPEGVMADRAREQPLQEDPHCACRLRPLPQRASFVASWWHL